jgi:PAS domain S-box-containing protein
MNSPDQFGETSMTAQSGDTSRSFDSNAFHRQADILNIVLDSLTQGMVVVGPNYQVLSFNRCCEELFQLPPGTIGVGVDFRDVLKTWKDATEQHQQMLERAIQELDRVTPFEFEFPQQIKGEPRWCQLTHNPLPGIGFVRTFTDITERKRSEDSLRISEERLRLAMLATQQGWFDLNLKTGEVIASREFARIIGAEDAHPLMTYQRWVDSIHRDDRSSVLQCFKECLNTGEIRQMEYRIMARTGEWKWVRSSARVVAFDEAGSPTRMTGTHADITERKRAEEQLAEMADRLTLASQAGGVGIWDWNVESNHLLWDDQMFRLYGMQADRFSGAYEAWMTGLHPEDLARGDAEIQMALGGEKAFDTEFRVVWPDGSIHDIRALAIVQRDASGQPLRMIGTNWDITDRKQAEAALRQSEQDYRHLFEMANDPIIIFEPETEIILEANQAACRTYGFDHDEFIGLDLKTLTSDIPRGELQIQALMASGLYHNFETVQLNKQGEEIHFLINSSVITYRGRKAILSLNRDIGDRKRLEAQLHHAQKMESLGTLAGGVAHDMNNVLGAILGLASAHIDSQPYGSPLHQALDTICKATERGGKMVKSLLSFARRNPSENAQLDINSILKEQVSLLERTTMSRVCLELDLEPELRSIRGDASALAHAFMNLCVNAVDAMHENGTLSLHTRNIDNDWIEVVVEDNGMGMSKDILEKAMDPFFTTKAPGKGTGLGLSMVFSTVKAHQGQMDIRSESGKGTRVRLRFPACEEESRATAPAVVDVAEHSSRRLKVLLVDDDDLIRSSVQAILEVLGHPAVTAVQSGEEALARLEAGFEPDLVILDMNMPGLGGAGTLPQLRGLRPDVPILLSTGRTDQTALTLASAHPGVTLLAKPFGLRELKKHLDNIGLG